MIDPLLTEAVERVLRERCTFDAVQAAEESGWASGVWDAMAEMGLPWISLDEGAGGSGGTLEEAVEVLRVAGRYAAPLPLAETGVLGGWLLAGAGLALDDQPLTVAPGRPEDSLTLAGDRLQGSAARVPWARSASRIVALVDDAEGCWLTVSTRDAVEVEPLVNLAGEPRDTVRFDGVPAERVLVDASVRTGLRVRGALSRAALMAGALGRMSELTVEYANDRRQFGKPVATFQAVQQHLIHTAQQAALVSLAVQAAVRALSDGDGTFEVAATKVLANEAASIATRAAHQAHGAIGMTQEYALHQLSRRLWAWRDEYGTEAAWARQLGEQVLAVGADQLYPLITAGSALAGSPSA
jgi:acyl-CoA dehydrogenase